MTQDLGTERAKFEAAVWRYYGNLKDKGWSHAEEGDFTPEALFWLQPNGQYGVKQIEAAWNGWMMKVTDAT